MSRALERLLARAYDLGSRDPQHYLLPFKITCTKASHPDRPMTERGIKNAEPAKPAATEKCPSIWCNAVPGHNRSMEDSYSLHMPFAQLPVEARALFFISASAALARYRSQPPTPSELEADLEAVWNTNRLSKGDLSDPNRLVRLLEEYFTPSASAAIGRDAGQRNRCFS
jgi:hypothetical protein